MKATELMIGDLVTYTGDDEGPITASIEGINEYSDFGIEILGTCERIEDIEPIPLTPEILEKNGWICTKGDNKPRHDIFYHTMLDYRHRLEVCPKGGFYWQTNGSLICGIVYVHELQHALRLCRLNDLADNFKI